MAIHRELQALKAPCFGLTELKQVLSGTDNSRFSKTKRSVDNGALVRIRRGLYCHGEVGFSQQRVHPYALADRIYGPSIVSLESALSYHGLIPESVQVVTSVTPRRCNFFRTPLGDYSYMTVPAQNFMTSAERIVEGNAVFFMATPWRALADYVYCYKKDWQSMDPLVESLRIDTEDLPVLTDEEIEALTSYFNQNRVSRFLMAVKRGQ